METVGNFLCVALLALSLIGWLWEIVSWRPAPSATGPAINRLTKGVSGMSNRVSPRKDVHMLALVKGPERFVFIFDATTQAECLRRFAHFAADPTLNFTWYDAAVLSQKLRDAVTNGVER